MNEKEKKEKLLISKLNSGKKDVILDTLKHFRNAGNSVLLPHVLDVLGKTNDLDIHEYIANMLRDIKEQRAVPFLVEAVKNDNLAGERTILVSSCWQSRLDFSHHLEVFVDVALKDEYETAIEAFTVIESFAPDISSKQLNNFIQKIKDNLSGLDEEKKILLVELINELTRARELSLARENIQ